MRTFLVGWLIAFCLVAVVAAGIGRLVAATPAPPTPQSGRRPSAVEDFGQAGPFSQSEALEIVSQRFGATRAGELMRRELRDSSSVSYYSPGHWRVCIGNACWIAHGPGRYAEPENDAARHLEETAASGQ
jgi:hypothetical protein